MNFLYYFMMTLSGWNNKIEVHLFDGVYDPAYLKPDRSNPDEWKRYADKIRDIYSKCLELPKVEKGYRDMAWFRDYCKRQWGFKIKQREEPR